MTAASRQAAGYPVTPGSAVKPLRSLTASPSAPSEPGLEVISEGQWYGGGYYHVSQSWQMVWAPCGAAIWAHNGAMGALRDRRTCHGATDIVGRHTRPGGAKPWSPCGTAGGRRAKSWSPCGAAVWARENECFGYKFRRSRGFIAVFAKILPVPATERREKAINLHACLDL